MSDRSSLSLSDQLELLERQEEDRLRGLISGHQSQSLRGQLAPSLAASALATTATGRKKTPRWVKLSGGIFAGLLTIAGSVFLYHHHRVHAQQAIEQARAAQLATIHVAQQADEKVKMNEAFTFAQHSPAFKTALDKATCPLGQKPLSESYAYGAPTTQLNEQGQGQLVVAYDAEHKVGAVVTCGGGG